MIITKYDQSCVMLEKNGRCLLIDPVEFSTKIPVVENIDAIIITHMHPDHYQPEILEKFRLSNPDAKIFVAEDMIDEIKQPAQIASLDKDIQVGEFNLSFFGKEHASIVDNISPCKNFGVIIDGAFVNPGDSFADPSITKPNILFVAISAPWLKIGEVMKYIALLAPNKVIPVHDGLLSPLGHKIIDNLVKKVCDDMGAEYIPLSSGENITI
jgi:L-ascorbate metabolism protein UlaG (beta-lactamase superfamily)